MLLLVDGTDRIEGMADAAGGSGTVERTVDTAAGGAARKQQ